MSDLLSIGTSALLTAQRQLATTSHNIANVSTDGYTRQTVEISARVGENQGAFTFGSGVEVASIRRNYDQFLTAQLRGYTSSQAEMDTKFVIGDQVQSVLASDSIGIGTSIDSFFNALQTVADDPTSIAARQVLLSEGDALSDRFKTIDDFLVNLEGSTNNEISATIGSINSLGDELADVNATLIRTAHTNADQNDLLDRRDQLLRDLSGLVDVKTIEDSTGSVNVLIGSGQTLVVGSENFGLVAVGNKFDASRPDVGIRTGNFTTNVTNEMSGGKLGGLLQSRTEMLDHTRNSLGRLASTISQTINEQHHLGSDLFGALGGEFFQVSGPSVIAAPNNPVDAKTLTVSMQSLQPGTNTINSVASVMSLSAVAGNGTAGDSYSVDVDSHTLTVTADGTTSLAQLLQTEASSVLGGYGYTASGLTGTAFNLTKPDGTNIALSNFQNLAGAGGSVTAAAVSGGSLASTTLTNNGDSATQSADTTAALLAFNDAYQSGEVVTLDVNGSTVSFNAGANAIATAGAFATAMTVSGMTATNNGNGSVTLQKAAVGNNDIANSGLSGITVSNLTASAAGVASVAVSADGSSTGTTAVLTDSRINQLSTSDYSVTVDASGDYMLQRLSDDFRVNLGANTTGGDLLSVDGLSFNVSTAGTTRSGDAYLVKPTSSAGQSFEMALSDPSLLAAASPARINVAAGNSGGLSVSQLTATDVSVATFATASKALSPPVSIQFTSPTQYNIVRSSDNRALASGLTFQQGQDVLDVNGLDFGMSLTFSGVPAAGDSFSVEYNADGVGDNQNALALAQALDRLSLEGGTANIQEGYSQLIGEVGKLARVAKLGGEAQSALAAQTESQRSATSGVNLDEEAADLLRFQQSYQAAAQVVRTANDLFDTLLNAI